MATVYQMFSGSFQLPTTAEHCFGVLTVLSADYRELGSSRKLGGVAEKLIDDSEKRFLSRAFNFRVRMLLKGAVRIIPNLRLEC